ncbi:hypothetical protein FHG87_006780 [Trinorchestia longiramus]|nr:hypothetical protein FHG87_006780 [Trinorchestia longiramus]
MRKTIPESQTLAWIPFIGEENHHKHLHPGTKHGKRDLLQQLSLNSSQPGVIVAERRLRNSTIFSLKEAYSNGHASHCITHEEVQETLLALLL